MKTIKNKKGFTLLELLVVVLIIGILAAVALPQYKQAVDRSELAKLQTYAKSLAESYNRYYLLHDKGTDKFAELDIDFPYNEEKKTGLNICRINGDMYCCLAPEYNNAITCGKTNYRFGIWINFIPTNSYTWCVANSSDHIATKLCEQMWDKSKIWQATGFLTPEGFSSYTHKQYSI